LANIGAVALLASLTGRICGFLTFFEEGKGMETGSGSRYGYIPNTEYNSTSSD
jgi:hypothetical protein